MHEIKPEEEKKERRRRKEENNKINKRIEENPLL